MASTVYDLIQVFFALAYWNRNGKASRFLDRRSIGLAEDAFRTYLATMDASDLSVKDAVGAVELFWTLAIYLVRFSLRTTTSPRALGAATAAADAHAEHWDNTSLDSDMDSFPCHICHQVGEFRHRIRLEPCGVSLSTYSCLQAPCLKVRNQHLACLPCWETGKALSILSGLVRCLCCDQVVFGPLPGQTPCWKPSLTLSAPVGAGFRRDLLDKPQKDVYSFFAAKLIYSLAKVSKDAYSRGE
jgi:hypothetical protein